MKVFTADELIAAIKSAANASPKDGCMNAMPFIFSQYLEEQKWKM